MQPKKHKDKLKAQPPDNHHNFRCCQMEGGGEEE